jgi:predicted porin
MRRALRSGQVLLLPLTLAVWHLGAADTPSSPTEAPAPEAVEEALERESEAGEDPLSQRRTDLVERPADWAEEPNGVSLYGSVRIRYSYSDVDSYWGDGGTRAGLDGRYQYRPRQWLHGRLEIGINLADALDQIVNRKGRGSDYEIGSNASLRILYLGIETPRHVTTFGKNWSAFYQVADFTDRFESFGGSASGAYNAGTDGGPTGTGRADEVLQGRFTLGQGTLIGDRNPVTVNLQVQYGQDIPQLEEETYGVALGLSALSKPTEKLTVGIAYNHAEVDAETRDSATGSGLDGDAQAALLGARWVDERWSAGFVLSRLKNHETSDAGVYFDGTGSELFVAANLAGPWWVVGGWNTLEPDNDQNRAGSYRIRYGVLGLRYTFDRFRQMLYVEVRLDDSRSTGGDETGNIYTAGVRWDLP